MVPNPYLVEALARQKQHELERKARLAWQSPQERHPTGRRRLALLAAAASVAAALAWRLASIL
jgi:hypothetical protein